jgi:hypothetical protein
MPPDEFLGRALEALGEPRTTILAAQLETEDGEEGEVPQLLGDVIRVARSDGFPRLDGFFGQVRGHALEGLLAIPGAAVTAP